MDQYVPPLVAVTTGTVVVLLCFVLRIPFFIIGVLSILMACYALQDHIVRFSYEYSNPTAPSFFKENASIIITILVIILSLGFLLFQFGSRAITTNAPTRYDTENQSGILGAAGKALGGPTRRESDPYARSSTYKNL